MAETKTSSRVDALKHNPLDSNDLRAWVSLATKLECELQSAAEARERLQQHALKYVDPLLGSDRLAKDAEDWIDNRLARHGESHAALVGIFPADMGMLANALKSWRLRLYKATTRAERLQSLLQQARPYIDRHCGQGQEELLKAIDEGMK